MKYFSMFSGVRGTEIFINHLFLRIIMANKYTWKPFTDKKTLSSLYGRGLTQKQIGEKFGVTQKVVYTLMKKWNIETRIPKNLNQTGENNPNWKGSKASYKALHYRIYKIKGMPRKCEICNEDDKNKRYEWANLTGRYDDPNDYKRMCKSCHAKHDKLYKNFGVGGDVQ